MTTSGAGVVHTGSPFQNSQDQDARHTHGRPRRDAQSSRTTRTSVESSSRNMGLPALCWAATNDYLPAHPTTSWNMVQPHERSGQPRVQVQVTAPKSRAEMQDSIRTRFGVRRCQRHRVGMCDVLVPETAAQHTNSHVRDAMPRPPRRHVVTTSDT